MIVLRTPSCVSAGGHRIDRQPVQVQSDPVQSTPVQSYGRPVRPQLDVPHCSACNCAMMV